MDFAKRLDLLGTETAFLVSVQAADWAAKGNKVYPFHIGDINLPTPQNIVDAAAKAIRDRKTGYSPGQGILPLREALADNVGSMRGVHYVSDNVSIQPGGKPTIGKFISAIMNPGDEILYPNPGYPIYESQIEFQGGVAVPYGYIETENGFTINLENLEKSISGRSKALIYNNYQNPICAASTSEEMERIARLALKHDLWVLSDEAYFDINYLHDSQSIVAIPGMLERTVILYTFSKKFAMTGWRLGAAIGPEKLIQVINKLNINAESCSNHFIQYAGLEGILGDQSGPDQILKELEKRRDVAVSVLNTIDGINLATPKSTFYLFPNVTEIGRRKGFNTVDELQEKTLHNTGVSFCTRNHFGRPLPGEKDFFVRLAYSGINIDEIEEALTKLKDYYES